jgi:signal transduction histidine kinase
LYALRALFATEDRVERLQFRRFIESLDLKQQYPGFEHTLGGSAEQLTALSRRLVDAQETERRELSRELHDRAGQNLTALTINLDILRTSLGENTHAAQRGRIDDSARLLERTADSIENVMTELRPPMLDDYGFLPALHWYARDFSERTGIDVHVSTPRPRCRWSASPRTAATRFAPSRKRVLTSSSWITACRSSAAPKRHGSSASAARTLA